MTEQQPIKNQLQVDFEEAITEKNKTISRLEKERDSAISAQMRSEKTIDDLKAEKQTALDKAERAQARYLKDQELTARSQQQETSLLHTLFGGSQ